MKIKVLDNKEIVLTVSNMSPERFTKKANKYEQVEYPQTTIKDDEQDVFLTASKMNDRNIDYVGVNDVRLEDDPDAENAAAVGHLAEDNIALEKKRSKKQNVVQLNLGEAKDVSPTLQQHISSHIGEQDNEPTNDLGENLKSEGNKMLNSAFGIGTAIKEIKNTFDPEEVELNQYDIAMTKLAAWKSEHIKTLHTTDWYETPFLNQPHNAANNMKDDFRGELGKSTSVASGGFGTGNAWATLGGDALNMLAGGSNVNTVAQIAGSFGAGGGDAGDASWQADLDEIAVLGTTTKDTMYTGKPGIRIKAHRSDGMVENITGRTENSYNGSFENGNNPIEAIRKKTREKIAAEKDKKKPKWFGGLVDGTIAKQGENYTFEYSAADGLYKWSKEQSPFSTKDLTEDQMKIVTFLKNKNTFNKHLGYLYIRPFYDYKQQDNTTQKGFRFFDIPFEFNPEISESATTANYASETLLGRLGQFHIFTGTQLPTLNITLTYMALAPDVLSDEDLQKMSKQYSTDVWQYFWTNNKIEEIELKLRSLVFADYVSGDYLIKPPLVELHLENDLGQDMDKIGDLFKYPNGINQKSSVNDKGEQETVYELSDNVGGNYLAYSTALHGTSDSNRYKRYIVTSVQIDKISGDSDLIFPSLYGRKYNPGQGGHPMYHLTTGADNEKGAQGYAGYTRKKGFRATLSLTEVTENFLDLVPDFKAYYDAWMFKQQLSYNQSQVSSYQLGEPTRAEMLQNTSDILAANRQTLEGTLASGAEKLNLYYDITYNLFRLYALANTDNIIKPGSTKPIKNPSKIYAYNQKANPFTFITGLDVQNPEHIELAEMQSNMLQSMTYKPIKLSNIYTTISGDKNDKTPEQANIELKDTLKDIYVPNISKDGEKIDRFYKRESVKFDNMTNAVIYLDNLVDAVEKIDKKSQEISTITPTLSDIKLSKSFNGVTNKDLEYIYNYYNKTDIGSYKPTLDKLKVDIDKAVVDFINEVEPDENATVRVETIGYNKPDANSTKGKKFKQITTLEALVKFLGKDAADKVYIAYKDSQIRFQNSAKDCYDQLNYNIKPEKIASELATQISKTWPFQRFNKVQEIAKDNACSIVTGGDFNVVKEVKAKKEVKIQLPQMLYDGKFVSICEYNLEDFTYNYEGRDTPLQIYDYKTTKAAEILGVRDVLAGIEDLYNSAYKAYNSLIKDPYSAEIQSSSLVNNVSMAYSQNISDVKGLESIEEICKKVRLQLDALLVKESQSFEMYMKSIDNNYRKEKIQETIDTYFKFTGDNANDLYKKGDTAEKPNSFVDAVPKNSDTFDMGKNDNNPGKLLCYKTNGKHTLKETHFPEDRLDYDQDTANEADHGLIWQLEKKSAYFREISNDLSKATNEQALRNYDKLSGSAERSR